VQARRRTFLAPAAAGFVLQVVLVIVTSPRSVDLANLAGVAAALDRHAIDVWTGSQWPYPGGYLPWLWVVSRLVDATGMPFVDLVRLLPVAASAVTAGLVGAALARRGRSELVVASSTLLIAAGPAVLGVDVYLGQIDATIALLAVVAVLLWDRGGGHRAWTAGLALGLAVAIKQPIVIVAAPLVVGAATRREAAWFVVAVALPPLALTAPYLVLDAGRVLRTITDYNGVPGIAGPSRVVYSGFLDPVLGRGPFVPAPDWVVRLLDVQTPLVVVAAVVMSVGARLRGIPDAVGRSGLIWAACLALMFSFSYQYLLWALPLLLLADRRVLAWAVSLLLAVPMLQVFVLAPGVPLSGLYTPLVGLAWLALVVAAVLDVRGLGRARAGAADRVAGEAVGA
jgi:hypothetical protein